jgi:uncharacterized protein (DUF2249 family)
MTDATLGRLTPILVRAVRALGEAGEPARANRLAAEAYAVLRHDAPRAAEHINGVMHHLVRLERTLSERNPPVTDATQTRVLDVRQEPPIRRHTLIFESYEALDPGAAFDLVNDHDPKPLYYQFAAEKAGEFSWDYLEQGPEVWRVRIGRVSESAS